MQDEAVDLCASLIRFDTSNAGGGEARGERPAAEWVAARLTDAGLTPHVVESAPGRASVVARVPGTDPGRGALLVHGHLDVVPAVAADWTVDPFAGEVRGGYVWGRGALDMKDMCATVLAVVSGWAREGRRPRRDLVLAFVADEEDTGAYGAGHLVEHHAHLFESVTDAVGESGGFPVHLPNGARVYPVATAERGTAWMRLTASGAAGHGSTVGLDNAVTRLARAVARLGDHSWPTTLTPTVAALLEGLADALGRPLDPADPDMPDALGEARRIVASTLRNSVNPTMLEAGYKLNVVPSEAVAHVDGRLLPGTEDDFFATVDALLGEGVTREMVSLQHPVEAPVGTPTYEAMSDALRAEDPDAVVVPYCMSGGTDAKWFARLGIACYGFAPARFDPGFDHWPLVHGVDERVPVESLRFGVRVLDRFLAA